MKELLALAGTALFLCLPHYTTEYGKIKPGKEVSA